MAIDWSLSRFNYAKLPDLGDWLKERQSYRAGERRAKSEESALTEQEARTDAFHKFRDAPMAAPQVANTAPQIQQNPQALALPQPNLPGALSQSMAPQIPPGMPLVKPPEDQMPGVKLPANMSPAATNQAKELVQAVKAPMNDYESRVQAAYGGPQQYAPPPAVRAMMTPDQAVAGYEKFQAQEAQRLKSIRQTVAQQMAAEARALAAAAKKEMDPAKKANLEAHTKSMLWSMQHQLDPETKLQMQHEQRMELLEVIVGSREGIAADRGSAEAERFKSELDLKRADQENNFNLKNRQIDADIYRDAIKRYDDQIGEHKVEAARLAAMGKDASQVEAAIKILRGQQAELSRGWFKAPVVIPASSRPTQEKPTFPARPEFQRSGGGTSSATKAPVQPAGQKAPDVSGAKGMTPKPDFENKSDVKTEGDGYQKPGIETPPRVQNNKNDQGRGGIMGALEKYRKKKVK